VRKLRTLMLVTVLVALLMGIFHREHVGGLYYTADYLACAWFSFGFIRSDTEAFLFVRWNQRHTVYPPAWPAL
jgi:hypothetical protein